MGLLRSQWVLVLALTGCASTPDGTSNIDLIVAQGKDAIYKSGLVQVEALSCAIKYADENWKAAQPSEIGTAALMVCASKEAEFSAHQTVYFRNLEILSTSNSKSYSHSNVQGLVGAEIVRFRKNIVDAATGRAVNNKIKAANLNPIHDKNTQ